MRRRFHKILIANRGEIAVRIVRTARRLGIRTVAVYALDDEQSLHVALADEAFLLEGSLLAETYLNQQKLVELAKQAGADAIHPGYGFLSENAAFSALVEAAGIAFIGATPEQIKLMGEKTRAIDFVKKLGVPVLPGLRGTVDEILENIGQLDFPVLVKAAAGGGGKGMQIVSKADDLAAALEQAQRQALEYFSNGELFVEKYLPQARHVEVQLMGDGAGNAVHLFERDCSLQRRYQKVVEEAPAANLSDETRVSLHQNALAIVKASEYRGAGTIEFLVDEQQNCWFLEMNTRLQVEHPVTEMITGLDLVEWQLEIAAGNGLPLAQDDIQACGHAIEVRICAEDPAHHFVPSSGTITAVQYSEQARWDSFVSEGCQLSPAYDSMLGKLVVYGATREQAIAEMSRSLDLLLLGGIKTNQAFLKVLVQQEAFRKMTVHTKYIEQNLSELLAQLEVRRTEVSPAVPAVAYILHHFYSVEDGSNELGYWRLNPNFEIEVDGQAVQLLVRKQKKGYLFQYKNEPLFVSAVLYNNYCVSFNLNGKKQDVFWNEKKNLTEIQSQTFRFELKSKQVPGKVSLNRQTSTLNGELQSRIVADLFGKVVDVFVAPGDQLIKGQNLLVIESMKTEFTIQSPVDAVVKNIHVTKGKIVQDKEILVDLEARS
ncbi:acetyl/propionyl/methylcrotonyl-CoA carboxylase subunit alpha [Mangrovibacterium diazotrophicum]|uniref:3-methylcrotonyl-CoA carboxylase alpha subunit n=1 Tax=Mangrovibacterium diazotrophicum TaxID=1261403 RepID=A0A419W843_9BACT|nr:biotin carboxylase N-terminal domain-containing protein [Mangrovibacterium diazotrophicum]RKD91624.1 3-methylcrotonyl-CoA carboxylase alpha subunit [Mangrovibacterium diazotrophicum]